MSADQDNSAPRKRGFAASTAVTEVGGMLKHTRVSNEHTASERSQSADTAASSAASTHGRANCEAVVPVRQRLFEWADTPASLRAITNVLGGILEYCDFTIRTDAQGKNYVRVFMLNPEGCCCISFMYYPDEPLVKASTRDFDFRLKVSDLSCHLRKDIMPNDFVVFLQVFADAPLQLDVMFRRDLTIRRRHVDVVLPNKDDEMVPSFTPSWQITMPLKVFKNELDGTKADDEAIVSFELRRDDCTGRSYFGILQTKGDLWQYAPVSRTDGTHKVHEYSVPDAADSENADANADADTCDFGLEHLDFAAMYPVFKEMSYKASYLAKFVGSITAKNITLKISDHKSLPDGTPDPQPIVVEHCVGKACTFTFVLSAPTRD